MAFEEKAANSLFRFGTATADNRMGVRREHSVWRSPTSDLRGTNTINVMTGGSAGGGVAKRSNQGEQPAAPRTGR